MTEQYQWNFTSYMVCWQPLLFWFHKKRGDEVFAIFWYCFKFFHIEIKWSTCDIVECLSIRVTKERRITREEDVANDPNRPHVSLGRDWFIIDNLWSQELWSSTHNSFLTIRPLNINVIFREDNMKFWKSKINEIPNRFLLQLYCLTESRHILKCPRNLK